MFVVTAYWFRNLNLLVMKYALACLFFSFALLFSCKKDPVTPAEEKYFPQVKSIIHDYCLSCHSANGSWAGRPTAFDTDTEIVAAAASIKAAVADPITPGPLGNKRMPQDTVLAQSKVDIIVKWLEKGGKATD